MSLTASVSGIFFGIHIVIFLASFSISTNLQLEMHDCPTLILPERVFSKIIS